MTFIGDSRMRQLWWATLQYLRHFHSSEDRFNAAQIETKFRMKVGDIITQNIGNRVHTKYFFKYHSSTMTDRFNTTLKDLDYLVTSNLIHDIHPVSHKPLKERKAHWPQIIKGYKENIKSFLNMVSHFIC